MITGFDGNKDEFVSMMPLRSFGSIEKGVRKNG